METAQLDFHMEEYKQLRAECMSLLARIETLFRYSLIVLASVFSWLIVNSLGAVAEPAGIGVCLKLPKLLLAFGWVIPPLFIAFAGQMGFLTYERVEKMGKYLTELENAIGSKDLGWEKFIDKQAATLTPQTAKAWWGVFALSVVFAVVGLSATMAASMACPVK